MTGPSIGNAHAQFRAGVALRSTDECDAQMSGSAFGAGYQDDFCSYESIFDWSADPRYPGVAGFESGYQLVTDSPWNGKQSLRILGDVGGRDLFLPDAPSSVTNLWARLVFRLMPGGLGPNPSELAKLVYDFGGGFYFDFNGDGTTSAPRYTGTAGSPNWEPGLIQYDDGSWWELLVNMDNTVLTAFRMGTYVRHAGTTGAAYSDVVTDNGTGWTEGAVQFEVRAPSEPAPYPWLDIGAWEWVDGSVHADPFGVGA